VLFDWDGTLVDNWDAIVAGINQALAGGEANDASGHVPATGNTAGR